MFKFYSNELEKGVFALEMEDYEKHYTTLVLKQLGNPTAQYNLGIMYVCIGVEKDFNEALGWLILASDNGHMLSKYALGLMYYKVKV